MRVVSGSLLKSFFWLHMLVTLLRYEPIEAGVIAGTTNNLYKKLLKIRTLPFEDCGSRVDILYLSISSCTTIPCQMESGSYATVTVIFDSSGSTITFLKHRVRWVFNAVRTEALITPDPCEGATQCISDETDGKTYTAKVYVDKTLPVMRGVMLWEAMDQYNDDVICFQVPVVIKN